MEQYPDVEPAVPASFATPSRTEKVLRPGIVLVAVLLLLAVSLVVVIVAWQIFSSQDPRAKSTNATQVFALIASAASVAYILLHVISAAYNEPIGTARPPPSSLHGNCFVVARLALASWVLALIITAIVVSELKDCVPGTRNCRLQIADIVAASGGILASGIILTALEACKYPFQTPKFIHLPKTFTVRASAFNSLVDLLDRIKSPNVSRAPSVQNGSTSETSQPNVQRPLARRHSYHSDEAPERPLTPLLPMAQQPKPRGWGEEWIYLLKEVSPKRKRKGLQSLDSAISLGSKSSSDLSDGNSTCCCSKRSAMSKRPSCSRNVTASSSISNLSRRSPLSSMRSAEHPDILVRSELKFCASKVAPTHEWNSTRAAPISPLLPTADVYCLQRRSSLLPAPLSILKLSKELPLVPPKPVPQALARRNTVDIRVPGAYIDFRPSLEHERNMDEQMQKIEAEYISRIPSKRSQSKVPKRRPVGGFENKCSVTRVDSRARYREQRPTHQARRTTDLGHQVQEDLEVEDGSSQRKSFRRLSLGDISFELAHSLIEIESILRRHDKVQSV